MDELILMPFSKEESEEDFNLNVFIERGMEFGVLSSSNRFKPSSGNLYKFGLKADSGNYYWFFNGKPVVKGRINALKTYSALKQYCENKKIGQPFAYKKSK